MDEMEETGVKRRYGWHLLAYVVTAALIWLAAGAVTPETAGTATKDTAQASVILIAVVHSLYAMLLLCHSHGHSHRPPWPAPDTRQGRYDDWHEALDKSGSFVSLWLLVLLPILAIQKFVNPQAELAEGLAATLVGLLTVGGAYAALGNLRPALHTATGGRHRRTRLDLPQAWPGRILTAVAFLALWAVAFALGHLIHLDPDGSSDEGASGKPSTVAVAE